MNSSEIEALIDKICFGGSFIKVRSFEEKELILILKQPNIKDRNFINFIYDQALLEGEKLGLASEAELASIYESQGVWTKEDQKILDGIEADIKKLDDGIKDIDPKDKKNMRSAMRLKNAAEQAYTKYSDRKNSLFGFSREKHALGCKLKAIVYCCTYNQDESRYWPAWEDFENESDSSLVEQVISSFSSRDFCTVKQLRAVARSPQWRTRWSAAKKIGDLFGLPIVYLDIEQQTLIYWSQVYDSAYEAYERPTDDIIEDDEAFDKWLESESDKHDKEAKERFNKKKQESGPISSRVKNHGEIFVVTNPAVMAWDERTMCEPIEIPDVNEVYDLNDDRGKEFISKQMQKIKSSGMIEERELRNTVSSRMMIGAKKAGVYMEGNVRKTAWKKDYL